MNAKLAGWIGAILLIVALALLFILFLDLLPLLILAIGVVVFIGIVVVLIFSALVLIFAVPYYLVKKPAEVQPGSFSLEQVKER